ncbi:hypothetical protein L2E82_06951 [Cichorium intybus]|uniref:Uncharacterized protein n=1 Tax=Cichorium intybus TaxID=13427 RepID=A0ACB9G3A6_CICIN|nr:hypothetical protein L2E82_06951 [Cichorium intybus]
MEESVSILSKLQSSTDLSSISHLFSSYLHPFTAIISKPKNQSKFSETNAEASTIIHSLAKKFTSFLKKALNIIPTRLNETPKIESCYASELFEAYTLCLSCLESVLPVLSCKPISVQFQRLRLIHCYEDWGRYEDAKNEGFSVLEYIGKLSGERGGNLNREFIPELPKENGDKDVATLIMDINGKEKSLVDFLKVADFYAIKCLNATVDCYGAIATHFDKLAAEFSQVNLSPVDLILRLYAISLFVNKKAEKDISLPKTLLNMEDQLQNITATLGSLTCQCKITEKTYVPLWFSALRFLCGSLSKLVITERKDILCGLEDVSFSIKLPNIQEAFHQFGLVFLAYRTYERERDVYEDNMQTVLSIAVASFTLSFATKENIKESTVFLMHLISADWVKANGLKFLFPNLHNVGILLYRANRLKEAAKSLKLCSQAAWNRVLLVCKMFRDGFSSDAIAGFVTEACAETASLLEILHLCGSSNKMRKILIDSLGNWSIAYSLFEKIPCPIALINQWVNIECEQIKDPEAGHMIPTIYSLMSSFKISKQTFGILVEEELQAYKELESLYPTLCKTMQMTIINILLDDIYTTKDSWLQRSRILIAKGRVSRAYGVEGLNDCIKYLSEAISIMSEYKSKDHTGPVSHLLAQAYCLHALCTQEAEPNSKHFIQDVGNALKLWLSQEHEQTQNTLTLLYYVADLLSLKGYMEHHSDIYETMIGFFTQKNIPLQELLSMLWQSRSLSHALCASPVSDAFIITFTNHCNVSKSVAFWISCMERSKSLEVGFRQSLSVFSTLSSPDSNKHNHITIREVKKAASDLMNNVPLSNNSLFLAAQLYYDLGETMIAKGSMIQALHYAKEAHHLRTKLLLKNFRCLIEPQNDIVSATGETIQKCRYAPETFHMYSAMATAAWPYDEGSGDFLTPWNVLGVYLESTLQAETFYRSATEKLKVSEWKNCVSDSEAASGRNTMLCDALLIGRNAVNKETSKSKKTIKTLPKQQRTSRIITRSCKQKGEHECAQNEVKGKSQQKVDCIVTCGCEGTCVSCEVKCWHCLPSEIMKSMSLTSLIQMKWECIRRRLLLRLLTGIGKCLGVGGEIKRAVEVLLESISMLVSRSTFHSSHFSISICFLTELIEKNVTADVFAVEHALILYHICCFSLATRNDGCDMSSLIPIPVVVSGLKLSFILCREVPIIFQKVSLLLAVVYTLSPSNKAFSMLSSSSNVLSESQWASYFHQASLGTHFNYQSFSRIGKQRGQNIMDVDDSSYPCRLAPESVLDLEEFISKFFGGLPHLTIICVSMLGEYFTSLLRELLPNNLHTRAWIILSRLNSDSLPIVILLPITSILAGKSQKNQNDNLISSSLFNKKSSHKSWHCPWGHTIIDDVAPLFKTILEEHYISSMACPLEDTKENWSLWWNPRIKLDQLLGDLLRDVEDLWFGPWKHLLLGESLDNKHIDSIRKKLMNDLKSEFKVDVHESILKLITGCGGHASCQEEWLSELILKKGCYVGGTKSHEDGSCMAYSSKQEKVDILSSVSKLILNATHEIGQENVVDRGPVILVLDFDIQMLPWENLRVLRNQEVYRMPSVTSIFSTLDRCCQYQEKVGKDSAVFPMIDPLDAYYLLNPDGDLPYSEVTFKNWFKDQNLEGTAGTSPTVDELSVALKDHDLFMYFGHGSGMLSLHSCISVELFILSFLFDGDLGVQYIPGDEIQKLDGCAATLLMGCRSGSLSLNGSYIPKGAPLYYLSAGSPVIVANLWEVTDKDINRFGKALLDAWIRIRSSSSANCARCIEISGKLNNMNLDGDKRKEKRKTSRKKSIEVNTCTLGCINRPRIGSFMGQARQACTLPFLIGASPVCYGVPTCITKKDL